MGNWYLPNGLVYRSNTLSEESILIIDGQIVAFGVDADEARKHFQGTIVDYNAENLLITRGLIDLHTHLREPGLEDKETILTGTEAAAAGGFTEVCAMPNTRPALDSVDRLYALRERIFSCAKVKIHPIAALTSGRLGQKVVDYEELAEKGIVLFSDDGDPLEENIAETIFIGIRNVNGVLINHLEDRSLVNEGFFCPQIPSESEYLMLKRDLEFVKKTFCRYHAAHLSCFQSVDLISKAKSLSLPVTAEVTPHHLTLTFADLKEPLGNFQMKPPLRQERDRQSLILGLKNEIIDVVATDHAPHGKEKEDGLFPNSPFGITGLETAFPVLYSKLVLTKQLSLERLLASLTVSPAKILGVPGELQIGNPADLTVLDLSTERKVRKSNFKSKGTNSPYIGESFRGWPLLTLLKGKVVFRLDEHDF